MDAFSEEEELNNAAKKLEKRRSFGDPGDEYVFSFD